jgi:hypothetical protein
MTTSTTADVGRRSKEPAVEEIHGFRGRLISADHADYDIARAVWNGAIDRRPRLIARCIGTADVVAAVRFARENDLVIAIRGGGHNVAGTAVSRDSCWIVGPIPTFGRRCGHASSRDTAARHCAIIATSRRSAGASSTMRESS